MRYTEEISWTACGDYLTLESLEALADEATEIRQAIVVAGGMARKSAVEQILINKYEDQGLDRYWAHEVLNRCEFLNLRHRGADPDLSDWAQYLEGADIAVVSVRK